MGSGPAGLRALSGNVSVLTIEVLFFTHLIISNKIDMVIVFDQL